MGLFRRQIVVRRPTGRRPVYLRKRERGPNIGAAFLAFCLVGGALAFISGALGDGVPRALLASGKAPETIDGRVARIIDGDTLTLEGVDASIRLWGIDAAERNEPGGYSATRALTHITQGEQLSCKHLDTDRYDRIVAQCFLPDGRDVAAILIERGAAKEWRRYSGGYYSELAANAQ